MIAPNCAYFQIHKHVLKSCRGRDKEGEKAERERKNNNMRTKLNWIKQWMRDNRIGVCLCIFIVVLNAFIVHWSCIFPMSVVRKNVIKKRGTTTCSIRVGSKQTKHWRKKDLQQKPNRTDAFFSLRNTQRQTVFFSLHRPFDEHAQINKKSTSNTAEALKSPAKISVYSNFVYFHCCHFHWWIV